MKKYESEHYVFHYEANSLAERDISHIAAVQENCFQYICNVLQVKPDFKIKYYLCETAQNVGRIYGDNEPCNGFASMPDTIYAVYNEQVKCIGFHEDAHIISYTINRPDSPAIREGLAMYFDKKWWGIHNADWCRYYLEKDLYIPIQSLIDKNAFFSVADTISYPIVGAFTDYLLSTYGSNVYINFYRQKDSLSAVRRIYNKSLEQLNDEFEQYIMLFRVDEKIQQRMQELLDMQQ